MAASRKVETYGWPDDGQSPQIIYELLSFGKGGTEQYGGISKADHFKNICALGYPWVAKNWHDWYELMLWAWCNYEEIGMTGCVAGQTRILNPITGAAPTIQSLCETNTQPIVMTMNGGELACVPKMKGVADLFRITLESGVSFVATAHHRVMIKGGQYSYVSDLYLNDQLSSYAQIPQKSISELSLSTHRQDVDRCLKTLAGFLSDCHPSFRSCGGQLLTAKGNVQVFSPSQVYARKHIRSYGQKDVSESESQYTHSHVSEHRNAFELSDSQFGYLHYFRSDEKCARSLLMAFRALFPLPNDVLERTHYLHESTRPLSPSFSHPSMLDYENQEAPLNSHGQYLPYQETHERAHSSFQQPSQSSKETNSLTISGEQNHGFYHNETNAPLGYMVSQDKIVAIKKIGRDKYYDLTVPNSHHYFAEGAIHHNCASAHKTFFFSLLTLTEFLAAPNRTRAILSAPTVPALRGGVWARIKEAYGGIQQSVKSRFPYNMLDSKTTLQFKKGDDENAVIAVAVDSGSIESAIGKIQGKHPGRVVMLVDEAAQTQPAIFTARANLRTATDFFRFVAVANAVDQFDAHGVFCEPKDGWSTISDADESWETKTGICLHFDGLKSPNVKAGEKKYPKLFSQTDIESTRTNFGENSLEWWMYVRGFWPPTGIRSTFMDGAMIQSGLAMKSAQWLTGFTKKAFLDPAFTSGGDRCILRFAKMGEFIEGYRGMELWDRVHIKLVESPDNPVNYQIADRIIEECQERGLHPADFGMDVTSASGLADIIEQRWGRGIVRLSFGGASSDRPMSRTDTRPAKQLCSNKVTELWNRASKMVQEKSIRGLDAQTAREFCTRQFTMTGEKKKAESKEDMKKRTKGVSPDDADPVAGLCDMFYGEHGEGGGTSIDMNFINEWNKVAASKRIKSSYAAA